MKTQKRTIKFRGLRGCQEWVYGYFVNTPYGKSRIYTKPFAEASSNTWFEVIPETVGQFTGLHDKNGKEIYEGEIFKSKHNSLGNLLVNPVLIYEDLRWVLMGDNGNFEYLDYYETETELEIIGNIHESPELLNK